MTAMDKLKSMVGSAFQYKEDSVFITGYKQVGEKKDIVNIFLGNGNTIEVSFGDLPGKLKEFIRVHNENQLTVSPKPGTQLATNPVLSKLSDTVMQSIEQVQKDPNYIPQAKQIFQGVNTLMNIVKTEIAYSEFVKKNEE